MYYNDQPCFISDFSHEEGMYVSIKLDDEPIFVMSFRRRWGKLTTY